MGISEVRFRVFFFFLCSFSGFEVARRATTGLKGKLRWGFLFDLEVLRLIARSAIVLDKAARLLRGGGVPRLSAPPFLQEKRGGNEPPHNEPRERGNFALCLNHLPFILITLYVWITNFN